MDSSQVRRKLLSGDYKIRLVSAGRSEVWKTFGIVVDNNDSDLDFAACRNCKHVFSYRGRLSGTAALTRHKCKVFRSQTILSPVVKVLPSKLSTSMVAKDTITSACVNMVCQDLRPFDTVGGPGFIKLAQDLLNIQHKSPILLDAKDLLPHPTIVSHNVATTAEISRKSLATELKDAFMDASVAFTTDVWTDDHWQRSYFTITGHWINHSWDLNSHVLCTDEFIADQCNTGVNVKASLQSFLIQLGIDATHCRKVFTTDKGSNIIVALHEEEHLDCFNHVLNRVLQHAMQEKFCPESITLLIKACKRVVRYIKTNATENLLDKTVKQSYDTCWNSTYIMLESIHCQYEHIQQVFAQHKPKELHNTGIDINLLGELVQFLQPFLDAFEKCEGENQPNIHLVIPWFKKLQKHCQMSDTDSDSLLSLKKQVGKFLNTMFKPLPLHKLAVFLNPKQKSMRALSLEDREYVLQHVKDELSRLSSWAPTAQQQDDLSPSTSLSAKHHCTDHHEFDDIPLEETQTNELNQYQQFTVQGSDPILLWWKNNSHQFPALSIIARNTLCVMATSFPSERYFSVAGHVVSSRRTSLTPNSMKDILFMNSSIKATSKVDNLPQEKIAVDPSGNRATGEIKEEMDEDSGNGTIAKGLDVSRDDREEADLCRQRNTENIPPLSIEGNDALSSVSDSPKQDTEEVSVLGLPFHLGPIVKWSL